MKHLLLKLKVNKYDKSYDNIKTERKREWGGGDKESERERIEIRLYEVNSHGLSFSRNLIDFLFACTKKFRDKILLIETLCKCIFRGGWSASFEENEVKRWSV